MNNNSLLGLRESIQSGRAELIWDVPFTAPCTFGLRVKGGAILEQGAVIGYSDTVIPGTLRFNNNCLELRKFGVWNKISSTPIVGGTENAIVSFDANGNHQASNAILDGADLTGINMIETEIIIPPSGTTLKLGNALLNVPNADGAANQVLATDGASNLFFQTVTQPILPPPLTSAAGAAFGVIGNISYDDSFIYIKTGTGWKQVAITAF